MPVTVVIHTFQKWINYIWSEPIEVKGKKKKDNVKVACHTMCLSVYVFQLQIWRLFCPKVFGILVLDITQSSWRVLTGNPNRLWIRTVLVKRTNCNIHYPKWRILDDITSLAAVQQLSHLYVAKDHWHEFKTYCSACPLMHMLINRV